VRRRAIQKRNLGGLLVGDGEHILQSAIAISELVSAPLLALDALLANLFTSLGDSDFLSTMTGTQIIFVGSELVVESSGG